MNSYTTDDYLGPNSIIAGYFNNDSYLDLAIGNYDGSSIGILLGYGNGAFQNEIVTYISNKTHPTAMAVGDFNNDSRLDIVAVSLDDGNIAILLGNGDGTFLVQAIISTGGGSYPGAAAVGYFNNDLILDIVVTIGGTNRIGLYIGNGNGTFQNSKLSPTGSASEPSGIVVGDFNHDSYLDVATSNYGNSRVSVLLGYGNGSFRTQTSFPTGIECVWMDTADLNGDGHLDFVAINGKNNSVSVLLGFGNGTFRGQVTYPVGNSSSSFFIALADVNNDGRWDIVVPNTAENNIGILLGRGDGSFQAQTTIFIGDDAAPAAVAINDFNKDNLSDIAVANADWNEIDILLGMS